MRTATTKFTTSNSTNGTVDYAIKHPDTFIKGSHSGDNISKQYYKYNWMYIGNNALWGSLQGYDISASSTFKKSIFDPSSEGYMVPPYDAWMGAASGTSIFEGGAWDEQRSGGYLVTCNGQSLWFPACGFRNRKTGSLQELNVVHYWHNCPQGVDKGNAAEMMIKKTSVSATGAGYSRGNAESVRCVKIVK